MEELCRQCRWEHLSPKLSQIPSQMAYRSLCVYITWTPLCLSNRLVLLPKSNVKFVWWGCLAIQSILPMYDRDTTSSLLPNREDKLLVNMFLFPALLLRIPLTPLLLVTYTKSLFFWIATLTWWKSLCTSNNLQSDAVWRFVLLVLHGQECGFWTNSNLKIEIKVLNGIAGRWTKNASQWLQRMKAAIQQKPSVF